MEALFCSQKFLMQRLDLALHTVEVGAKGFVRTKSIQETFYYLYFYLRLIRYIHS